MKFLNRLFRYFYSTEVTTSESQLRKDFGVFPPKPLGGTGPTGKFTTVRVRGVGEHIHFVLMTKRLLKGSEDVDSLSSTIRDRMPDIIPKLAHLSNTNKAGYKVLRWIALGTLFFVSIFRRTRMNQKGANSLGFFVPLRKDEDEIVIKVGLLAREDRDATISHEHIHLLQHRENQATAYSCVVTCSDDEIFNELARTSKMLPHLKYILKRHEVEARLHELVVSFYRTHNRLPNSVPRFLALLASSKQLGWLVSELLASAGVNVDPPYEEISERDKLQIKDLEIVLLSMPDEAAIRFITEVLPVMYGNLLKYYGDDAVSRNFLSQISRPNFYDHLYALTTIVPTENNAQASVILK